ncbi:MAG TPA: hypothetical protein VEZ46_05240 [Mycobacteriales bacterium]|nr:hypothetical protein [Mycobacteriales bacterium]
MNDVELGLFRDYVDDSGPQLQRTAYLLTDSWDDAELLVRRALARTYLRWRTVNGADAHQHTMRALVRAYVGGRWRPRRPLRRRRSGRGDVWGAVQGLPRLERAALVLRCFNNRSMVDVARLLGRSSARAEEALTRAAETLTRSLAGHTRVKGLPLSAVLAAEMATRVANGPVLDRHETFMVVDRRARLTSFGRLLIGVAAAAAAVAPTAGSTAARTGTAIPSSPRATRDSAAGSPSGMPSSAASATSVATPTGALDVPVVLGRRVVEPRKGSLRTVVTIPSGAGAGSTALSAGGAYVIRTGPPGGAGELTLVSGERTRRLSTRAGSAAVNATGTRVAYVELDDDGDARRLLLLALPGGEPMQALAAPLDEIEVKGFIGDAILFDARSKAGDPVARRWNPVANNVTDLGGRYSAVLAVHAGKKLALLADTDASCTTSAFIEFGVVYPRGRSCAGGVTAGAFAPDAERVALVLGDSSRVVITRVRERLPTVVSFTIGRDVRQLAWESDSALAVVSGAGATTEVLRCSIKTESCTSVWTPQAAVELVR